jgi:hypothetical protein
MSEPITLTFIHREKEYVTATRLIYARVYHTRFLMIVSSIVLALGLFLISTNADFIMGSVAIVVGLVLLVFNLYAYFVTPRQYFRQNVKFQEEYSLRFSEEGLLFRSKGLESKLEWSFYSKVWETRQFYFLCYDKDLFTLIPKRVFTSAEQQRAFRELLNRQLSANFESQELSGRDSNELQSEYIPPQSPPDWR